MTGVYVPLFMGSCAGFEPWSTSIKVHPWLQKRGEKLSDLPCVWLVTGANVTSTFSPSTTLSWPCLIFDIHVKEIATVHSTSFSK